jgi:hypothetical protein
MRTGRLQDEDSLMLSLPFMVRDLIAPEVLSRGCPKISQDILSHDLYIPA